MKVVLQRVLKAKVIIDEQIYSGINAGLLLLLGVAENDSKVDIDYLVQKICNLRIFNDAQGKMNLSVKEIDGDVLVVSQFTLFADTKKGNRPSFIKAAKPEIAIPLYENFCDAISQYLTKPIKTGRFAADMKIELVNDGPVTIVIDTDEKSLLTDS